MVMYVYKCAQIYTYIKLIIKLGKVNKCTHKINIKT